MYSAVFLKKLPTAFFDAEGVTAWKRYGICSKPSRYSGIKAVANLIGGNCANCDFFRLI